MRIKKYYKLIKVDYEDSAYFRITNTSNTGGMLTITSTNSSTFRIDLKYSIDGVNWSESLEGTPIPFTLEVDAGSNVYFKGTNPYPSGEYDNWQNNILMDVEHTIGGNILSIVDEINYATITSIPKFSFKNLFQNDINLTDVSKLNFGAATTFGEGCCDHMFYNCTSLTKGGDLSSVTSIGHYGCNGMYYGCTSLTEGSDLSSVTSIGNVGCGGLYYGCTSLTKVTAPNVPTWVNSTFGSWLYNVASTGVVRKPAGLDIPTNNASGIPTGWTTEDY